MKKATLVILIISAAIWLAVGIYGLVMYAEMQQAMQEGSESNNVGFIFAAIFIALFQVLGAALAVLALIFALVAGAAIPVLLLAKKRGALIAMGVVTLILGSPVAGILMLVSARKMAEEAQGE